MDSEAAVPDALLWAGVRAAAAHSTPSDAILDVRRHAGGVDYYYLFNQSAATTYQTLTLTGEGSPYHLDTWTGQVTPIAGHTAGRGTVTLPVRLAGHDAMVIAVTARRDATFHGPATPHTPIPEAGQGIAAPQPVRLTDWSLTVDSWTPGPSGLPGDTAHTTVGPVTVTANPDRTLPAWSQLGDALADLSGVGTYTTRVRLGPDWSPVHTAYLDLGTVVDTVKVNINGRDLPPVNPMDLGRVDVSTYLRPGDNTITVRVASTLRNAVRVAPGTGAASQPRMDYGLLGPVTITPHAAANTQLLTVEPTQRLLPLASGGYTEAEMLVTNNSNRAAQVSIDAAGPTGITASEVPTTVPAGGSATIPVSMRNTGKDSGTSVVAVTARTDNGLTATTQQWLNHSNNLALNTEGARYPRLVTETAQDRFPAELAVDGNPSTYYSSWGKSAGQGPTAHNPAMFGFDFGAPISVGSVSVGGQVDAGARTFTIEASNDGGSWRTVTTVSDHPVAGGTVSFGQITARYLRLRITDTWDTVRPNRHVEIGEVAVTS